MSRFEQTVEELKSLPPSKFEAAAGYIHQLTVSSFEDRRAALDRAFGCMKPEEADQLDRAVAENCEQTTPGT